MRGRPALTPALPNPTSTAKRRRRRPSISTSTRPETCLTRSMSRGSTSKMCRADQPAGTISGRSGSAAPSAMRTSASESRSQMSGGSRPAATPAARPLRAPGPRFRRWSPRRSPAAAAFRRARAGPSPRRPRGATVRTNRRARCRAAADPSFALPASRQVHLRARRTILWPRRCVQGFVAGVCSSRRCWRCRWRRRCFWPARRAPRRAIRCSARRAAPTSPTRRGQATPMPRPSS